MKKPRYLTKSRFKLALDCPAKLFYTRKSEYENQSETDTFLQALAQGGFQVEELARMQYPDGIAIEGDDYNYDLVAYRTKELLEQENVVIFEPAFLVDGLFIRVDILVKRGLNIELIEVKAKSTNHDSNQFIGKKGSLVAGWVPYLYDVAFQQYVIQKENPSWKIIPYLMLADKTKIASLDGLNQHFKTVQNSEMRTRILKTEDLTLEDLGDSILAKVNVEEAVSLIYEKNPLRPSESFEESILFFKSNYEQDSKIITPIGSKCKTCEFISLDEKDKKSGFHECWQEQLGISRSAINRPKSYDVWFSPARKALEGGRFFMEELREEDLNLKHLPDQLSRSERQLLQIEKEIAKDSTPYVDVDNLRLELSSWKFPLNFIDFETTAVAIPFFKGMRPYEQVAFQFSHHIVYEDGEVEHHKQYINTNPGEFPNFKFLRALKESLEVNDGSIFRYHNHENSILNVIHQQLQKSEEKDTKELLEFIELITTSTKSRTGTWQGARNMIDLQNTAVKYYFDPSTGGSNSIKNILPSVLLQSSYLQEKYAKPISAIVVSSLNFDSNQVFLHFENGIPVNPYKLLPPIFDGYTVEELENAVADFTDEEGGAIKDGGAALFAYNKLQFKDVPLIEREATENALLRYCELDTLAMVMIYECFREMVE